MGGSEKMEQFVHDLERNEEFQSQIAKVRSDSSAEERVAGIMDICRSFGIDWEIFSYIREKGPKELRSLLNKVDMFVVGYSAEEDLFGNPLHSQMEKQLHREVYPSSLDIHLWATKKDAHKFIDEHWSQIESWRKFVHGEIQPKKFHSRSKAQISEFAYDNRGMDRKLLYKKIKEKFSTKADFGYENLNALIADEIKRRRRDLKVKRLN